MQSNTSNKKLLIFKTGKDVKLTARAQYFSSIIADGKELITEEKMKGALVVEELKNPEVYVTFKAEVTDFTSVFERCRDLEEIPGNLFADNSEAKVFICSFLGCESLASVPENLFASCSKVTGFAGTFCECSSLEEVPEGLFANNPNARNFESIFRYCTSLQSVPVSLFDNTRDVRFFSGAFCGCGALKGETPYTLVNGEKVKLWERRQENGFVEPFAEFLYVSKTFEECNNLADYDQIPENWK